MKKVTTDFVLYVLKKGKDTKILNFKEISKGINKFYDLLSMILK